MSEIIIYQSPDNKTEIEVKLENDTVWLTQAQMVQLFDSSKSNVSEHLKSIFHSGELDYSSTVRKFRTVRKEGSRTVSRNLEYYNLDVIISLGYRINTRKGIQFRQWATERLKEYLIKGYTINLRRIEENKKQFLQTLEDLKLLTQKNKHIEAKEILSLIQSFSSTFFALNKYDKNEFPKHGTLQEVKASAKELYKDIQKLKSELMQKGEATALFAQEKKKGALESIFGNVFQTVFGQDAYPAVEEKAAHLLYFIVKNHPFTDGNKRCGAFSFIWLLQKAGYPFREKISPQTLTTLTLLIAESDPKDKEKMIGIVKLLFN
ncbi:MAG: virulence protein RhuM/Fic/DOC family protein [Bacteroidia bacterium]|nr:virulence protein RhuM/Fic/DOC family protein [Bacteroidia bacterium]